MSVREIVTIGDPVLRRRAREVSLHELRSAEVQELIDDLIETRRAADGAGLAANQVGVPLRIAVAEVVGTNPRYPYKPPIPLTVMVNPVIEPLDIKLLPEGPSSFRALRRSSDPETFDVNEGCLSVPDLRGELTRSVNIRVRYLDRDGAERDEEKRGLTAGTFQHEVDHLDGVLFIDRADPRTLATWEQFERHQRDDFVDRITEFTARVGS